MSLFDYLEETHVYDEGLYNINEFTIGFELEAWTERGEFDTFKRFANNYFKEGKFIKFLKTPKGQLINPWGIDYTVNPDGIIECEYCNGTGIVSETCYNCSGRGVIGDNCSTCNGRGHIVCKFCNGSGYDPRGPSLFEEKPDCPKCGGTGFVLCPDCDGTGFEDGSQKCNRCDGTGTVEDRCEECDGRGFIRESYEGSKQIFEWGSPIFNLTPANLELIINFLNESVTEKTVGTNETCGFHVHIGFPERSTRDIDMFWVLCHLATEQNKKILTDITSFKHFSLTNAEYAQMRNINKLKENLTNAAKMVSRNEVVTHEVLSDAFNLLKNAYSVTKYEILRQHPQGTLEWRGARHVLDRGLRQDIKDFFVTKLYPFIRWINDTLEMKELAYGQFKVSKADFRSFIKNKEWKSTTGREYREIRRTDSRFSDEMDGREIGKIMREFPWLGKRGVKFENADISSEKISEYLTILIWKNGTWKNGTWKNGVFEGGSFESGIWENGTFINGSFEGSVWKDGKASKVHFINVDIENILAYSCVFEDCVVHDGNVTHSLWKGGTWKGGKFKGSWQNGTFEGGDWFGEMESSYSSIDIKIPLSNKLIRLYRYEIERFDIGIKELINGINKGDKSLLEKIKIIQSNIVNVEVEKFANLSSSDRKLMKQLIKSLKSNEIIIRKFSDNQFYPEQNFKEFTHDFIQRDFPSYTLNIYSKCKTFILNTLEMELQNA